MVRGTELTSFDSCDYTRRIAAVPIPFDIVKTHLQSELRLALRCVPPRYDDLSTYTSTINGWTGGQLTVMAHLFNVGALFILFRETVEGSVILSVLLRAVDKAVDDPIRANQLKWHVWAGVIVGGVISIFVGGGFAVAFWVLGKDVFGNSKGVWEGSFMLLASILLTWLAFGMLKVSNLYAKWEAKIAEHAVSALKKPDFFGFDEPTGKHAHHQNSDSCVTSSPSPHSSTVVSPTGSSDPLNRRPGHARHPREGRIARFLREYSLGILSFTIVIREGMESVLFLTGVGQSDPVSLIIPGIVGITLGVGVGYAVWRGAAQMRLDLFFRFSAIFLFIVGAGLASNAAAAFEGYNVAKVLTALGGKIVLDVT
ncbi:hypothetical protein SeMB42_g03028 [Synchytrium endobioticum]|uniref:Iron permease FTR1 n=1 Tax=Synchytrium endobioticum TaxID=286115 RepID=A0A507D9Y8_9FUNG|nr:hypothetical protein SeMB42_g03028 [Synchytrium endobioticum]